MSLLRTSCILLVWVSTLLSAGVASASDASTPAPELNAVASQIAGQDVEVRCFLGEEDPDYYPDVWGYVFPLVPIIYIDPTVCAGARAIVSGAVVPLWEMAIGALVLTHEAYHLKIALPEWRRLDEAQTECRAVKRVRETILALGANESLADAILPWSIAAHYKESTFDEYDYPSCAVPVFSDFWG